MSLKNPAVTAPRIFATSPWLPLLMTVCCLAPFLNKAFSVDDPLFLWTAEQIGKTPANFYGFSVNWYGTVQPMSTVTKNPPLWCYALALFGRLGTTEVWMHLCGLVPALAVIFGTWKLAKSMDCPPGLAAVLVLSTPVFLVCSTNVMCDVALTAAWVWTVVLWKRGLQTGNAIWFVAASVLIAIAALTKYFGMALIPLLVVYTWIHYRRPVLSMLWLVVPCVALACYQVWTANLYGAGLLLDAGQYSVGTKLKSATGALQSLVTLLTFFGGCLFSIAMVACRNWSWKSLLLLCIPAFVTSALLALFPHLFFEELTRQRLRAPTFIIVQAGLFAAAAVLLIVESIRHVRAVWTADSVLLLLWILGTLVFAGGLNWTINGRTLLPLVPAIACVIAANLKRSEVDLPETIASRIRPELALVAVGILLSLTVTWADAVFANSARRAAAEFAERPPSSGKSIFQGHWGFQYYMQRAGFEAMDFDHIDLEPGDLVIVPMNNTNISLPPKGMCQMVEERTEFSSVPCTTMSNQWGTGFHSSVWGAVPFAFGPPSVERYQVWEVVTPIHRHRATR